MKQIWMYLVAVPVAVAQSQLLTLDDAVRMALEQNRSIQQAAIAANAGDDAIRAARTQRLPSFKTSTTSGLLLSRPTVTFERGAFGEYAGLGPIPGNTVNITSARKPTAIVSSEVSLPLTQQRRIGLGIRQLEIGKRIAEQQVRLTRQEVVKQVRQAYYSILQTQSSLDSLEQSLALLREMSSQTAQYVRVGTALDGDLLSVKARMAQAEYERTALQGPLANAKEQLNVLLGRSLEENFRVSPAIEADWVPDLADARSRAVSARPEIEQARLKLQQADIDKQKKKSELVPDVSLSVTYYSAFNTSSSLPRNVAIAGVQASWEVFDWGRKRSELAQKDKSIQEATLAMKDAEDKIRLEVGVAHRKMQEARMLLFASRAGQESATEAARLAAVRYRNNATLFRTVLEAQADLASANDRTQKALLAYWSARAELEKSMGEEQ